MKLPLYAPLAAATPACDPAKRNPGLWFDKFCNQWHANPPNSGSEGWSLKARPSGQNDGNPKLNWLKTVAGHAKIGDAALLAEHADRLAGLARALGGLALHFRTSSRFATGLGREHPVENGFIWHPPLGVPCLPGSSVKGLVRAWLEGGWSQDTVDPSAFHRIFGSGLRANPRQHGPLEGASPQAGSVIFLDAIPTAPIQLKPDVMTPHYGDYYAKGGPPADWLTPNPIPFLTVAIDQPFQFALAPRKPGGQERSDCGLAAQWLKVALHGIGAGAKTAVGYGRFHHDQPAETKADADYARRQAEAALAARLANLPPVAADFERECHAGNWESSGDAFKKEGVVECWLSKLEESPDRQAIVRLRGLVEKHFPGLLANPGKPGKKGNLYFGPRQNKLATRLNDLFNQAP